MTRYRCGLVLLAAVLPLLPFAGLAGGSTLSCGNNPASFTSGTTVTLTGTIANAPDHTYGQLTYPDLSKSSALTAVLGMDGINGTWEYNLGLLSATGAYTLTVFAENSDSTPCACGFSVTQGLMRNDQNHPKFQFVHAPGGQPAEGKPPGNLIKITEVRSMNLEGRRYVQVRGTVASQAPDMALHAHMITDAATSSSKKHRFFAKEVFRHKTPKSKSSDIFAEFDVSGFPAGIYSVRLSCTHPHGINTWWHAVIIDERGQPTLRH